LQWAGFVFSVGINTGVLGINIAHELSHKNNKFEQNLGKALLVSVGYGHFFIEHLYGHHRNVATPYDPATARYGEVVYTFWFRSVIGSYLSAWNIEARRLQKLGKSILNPFHNQMLQFAFFTIAIGAFAYYVYGINALNMYIGQAVVAFTLLEIVNYIEHYGLKRRELPDSKPGAPKYETVDIIHSWNADARITNLFLFKLQRHSDHHAYASRRYQILRTFNESPQMPTGYAGMVVMAVCPPLWFAVMNPKVKKFLEDQAKIPVGSRVKRTEPVAGWTRDFFGEPPEEQEPENADIVKAE